MYYVTEVSQYYRNKTDISPLLFILPTQEGLTNYLRLHRTITNAQTSMLDHSLAIKYAKTPEKNILSMCSEVDLLRQCDGSSMKSKGKSKSC